MSGSALTSLFAGGNRSFSWTTPAALNRRAFFWFAIDIHHTNLHMGPSPSFFSEGGRRRSWWFALLICWGGEENTPLAVGQDRNSLQPHAQEAHYRLVDAVVCVSSFAQIKWRNLNSWNMSANMKKSCALPHLSTPLPTPSSPSLPAIVRTTLLSPRSEDLGRDCCRNCHQVADSFVFFLLLLKWWCMYAIAQWRCWNWRTKGGTVVVGGKDHIFIFHPTIVIFI